jgi:hypothetical protein
VLVQVLVTVVAARRAPSLPVLHGLLAAWVLDCVIALTVTLATLAAGAASVSTVFLILNAGALLALPCAWLASLPRLGAQLEKR